MMLQQVTLSTVLKSFIEQRISLPFTQKPDGISGRVTMQVQPCHLPQPDTSPGNIIRALDLCTPKPLLLHALQV